jgi:DNA processing protein
VFAVPGPIGARASEGTNDLLASGEGRACLRADDVARAIGLTAAPAIAIQDPILDALAAGPLDLDALAARMGLPRMTLRARLVALVLAGAVADRGDGRFGRGPVS